MLTSDSVMTMNDTFQAEGKEKGRIEEEYKWTGQKAPAQGPKRQRETDRVPQRNNKEQSLTQFTRVYIVRGSAELFCLWGFRGQF